jgi:hypothetical protein
LDKPGAIRVVVDIFRIAGQFFGTVHKS